MVEETFYYDGDGTESAYSEEPTIPLLKNKL